MTRSEIETIINAARERGERADLRGADLSDADLRRANDLPGSSRSPSFSHARPKICRFLPSLFHPPFFGSFPQHPNGPQFA